MRKRVWLCLALTVWMTGPAELDAGTVRYTYDDAGRLIRTDYGEGVAVDYSYAENGALLAREASNPAGFSFPFYQAGGEVFNGFAASNASAVPAGLTFTARDGQGQLLPFPRNPADFVLEPGRQLALLGHEIFDTTAATSQSGWVLLNTDNPEIGSFFLAGSGLQLDGSVALTRQSKQLYFTRVFEGAGSFRGRPATTRISLANPSDAPVRVRLGLIGPGGQPLAAEQERMIAAGGVFFASVSEIFETAGPVESAYVAAEVIEGAGLVGFELIQPADGNTVIGLNASTGSPATEAYSAQLASALAIFTELKLINVGDQERTLTLTPVAENGVNLAAPVERVLAPGDLLEEDAASLFGFPAAEFTVGSIRLEADGPEVIGDVIFGDPADLRFAAAMPLQLLTFTKAVFSQVANTPDFFTGLAFYNPGTTPALVIIEVFSSEGDQTGSVELTIEPGHRLSRLVDELIPATTGQIRGYIVIRSSRPLIAQQLFGRFDLQLLSAVPPTILQ